MDPADALGMFPGADHFSSGLGLPIIWKAGAYPLLALLLLLGLYRGSQTPQSGNLDFEEPQAFVCLDD